MGCTYLRTRLGTEAADAWIILKIGTDMEIATERSHTVKRKKN